MTRWLVLLMFGLLASPGDFAAAAPARAKVHSKNKPSAASIAAAQKAQQAARAAARAAARQKARAEARRRADELGLGTRHTAAMLLAGRVEPRWKKAAGGDEAPGTLRFPVVKGWFVRGFGSGAGGYHQAMDIGGEFGWNVRAAAPGVVAYSGNGINGYGYMVMIVHPGGFVTSYAHNTKNFVIAGEEVARGDVIAELGSTGRSHGPHVHFELLVDGKNCDPAPLFRPQVKHRNGEPISVQRAIWRRRKPKTVSCRPRKHHPDYVQHQRKTGQDSLDMDRVDDEDIAAP
jgi:murein DD-endopeptidase MepM/ murein hydrolase activator NlpD